LTRPFGARSWRLDNQRLRGVESLDDLNGLHINLNAIPVFVHLAFDAYLVAGGDVLAKPALVVHFDGNGAAVILELVKFVADLSDDVAFQDHPRIIPHGFRLSDGGQPRCGSFESALSAGIAA